MRGWKLRLMICLALLLALPAVAAAQRASRPRLRFDPFQKPDLSAIATAGYGGGALSNEWSPTLAATLVAGEASLANLGGVVLALGEESHGYRLIEVRPWEAVFEHAGEQTVLPVTAPEGDRR